MRRAFGDVMMTAGGALALVLALVVMDDRVREQVNMRLLARPSVELAAAGHQVRGLASVIFEAAHRQTLDHAPLVIFGLAGGVLVVFMLRT